MLSTFPPCTRLVTPRGQSAYVASKFALRGFSDVLRLELFDHGVGVTTVYPGGVRTLIAWPDGPDWPFERIDFAAG
jgi:NAD(P)-dependent dehydrogenase (short-subunit alcohol dehydrogenase family)